MQLRPREYFTIARGLEDHLDSGTYYVRAVIRNARTDALIDTVNLTDQGNRRFSTPWQVPADTSGEGFYILITTTIYTDSGYTTKSGNYGEKFDTYLVQDRPNPNLGGGGGADIDYKKMRAMMREEIAGATPPEFPEVQSIDLRPLLDRLDEISSAVAGIPKVEKVNLRPVLDAIDGVRTAVKALPEPEKVDYSPFTEALTEFKGTGERVERGFTEVAKAFVEDVDALKEHFDKNLGDVLRRSDLKVLIDPPAAPPEKGPRKMPKP